MVNKSRFLDNAVRQSKQASTTHRFNIMFLPPTWPLTNRVLFFRGESIEMTFANATIESSIQITHFPEGSWGGGLFRNKSRYFKNMLRNKSRFLDKTVCFVLNVFQPEQLERPELHPAVVTLHYLNFTKPRGGKALVNSSLSQVVKIPDGRSISCTPMQCLQMLLSNAEEDFLLPSAARHLGTCLR